MFAEVVLGLVSVAAVVLPVGAVEADGRISRVIDVVVVVVLADARIAKVTGGSAEGRRGTRGGVARNGARGGSAGRLRGTREGGRFENIETPALT
jgi:hypothetical protein